MPVVRTYGERKVSPAALPGVRRTAAETPTSRGAGLEAAKAQTAETIAGLGAGVARLGVDAFTRMQIEERQRADETARMQIEERQRADETAVLEAENMVAAWEHQRLYDPEDGAFAVKGKAAMPLPEMVGAEYEQLAGAVADTLTTPRQRAAFARARAKGALNLDLTLRRHVFGEMQQYEASQLEQGVANGVNAAVAHALDPRRVGEELNAITAKIQTHGPRVGLGPEAVTAAVRAARSQVHVGVVTNLLANQKDTAASVYFDATKSEIAGDRLDEMMRALEEGGLRHAAQTQSDAIIRAGGTLTEQREKVRAIDDPKLRDAVQARIEHEGAVAERAAREQAETDVQDAYNLVERTGRFDAIPPPLLARLPGSTRSGLRSYALQKAKGLPIDTDLPTYYAMLQQAGEDPATFAAQNLLTYRHKLDEVEFKQLAGLQLSIRTGDRNKTDKDLAGFRTKNDILEDSLTQYGIDPKAKPTTPEGKAIAQLRRMLDRRVDAAQIGDKKVTNVEIQTALDDLLSQETTTPGSWWNIWPLGIRWGPNAPFRDTTQSLLKTEAADITAADRQVYEQVLRDRGRPVTHATVLDLHMETLVRRAHRQGR